MRYSLVDSVVSDVVRRRGGGGGGNPVGGLIDLLSVTPIFAASTRLLTFNHVLLPGATIRRVSDSTPYDAGFVGGPPSLDFAGINAHIGGSSGTWPKWWDQSASANHAVQATSGSQPAYVDGEGPSFNGTSSFLTVPHNANQLLTSGMTIAMSFRPADVVTAGRRLLAKGDDTNSNGGFGCYFNLSGQLRFRIDGGAGADSTQVFTADEDQHVIVTAAANGAVLFYRNNVAAGGGSTGACSGIDSTNPLRIGANYAGSASFYSGRFGDFIVLPGVVSEADRALLYAARSYA